MCLKSCHPCPHSTRISIRQAQVDKLYASLKELAGERRERLQEHLRLCQLRRELDDLEQWIQEREVVAASHELGQDYEHVTVSAGRAPAHQPQSCSGRCGGPPGRPAPPSGRASRGRGCKSGLSRHCPWVLNLKNLAEKRSWDCTQVGAKRKFPIVFSNRTQQHR